MNKIIDTLYKETLKAYKHDEVPVGCVITRDNKIIAKAHNTRQKTHKCINHAEINAIIKAEKKLKDWRLDGCDIYVSLKPCSMCAEVIKHARIANVYYLLDSNFNSNGKNQLFQKLSLKDDVKFTIILSNFFKNKR